MRKFIFWSALTFASLYLTSCQTEDSADVNQDKIYTEYELFYNENTDKTTAIARFRFGNPTGTLLEVNDPGAISFEGDPLTYNVLYNGHVKEYAGLLSSGTFSYTNVDGETFINTTPEMNSVNYPADFDTVYKSQANSIKWLGDPLMENERINLFIGSWTWGQDALSVTTGEGSTEIVLGTNQLENLSTGSSTCYMDRVTENQVTEGTSEGGLIRTRYRPKNIDITVLE